MGAPKGHPPYNKNGEGGRPVTQDEEFINKEADALELWLESGENRFIEDFAHKRGYSARRLYEWVKFNKRLAQSYELFMEKQRVGLFKGGLSKKLSYQMCALMLSYNHGIYAKTEQKLSGSDTDPLSFIFTKIDNNSKDLTDVE